MLKNSLWPLQHEPPKHPVQNIRVDTVTEIYVTVLILIYIYVTVLILIYIYVTVLILIGLPSTARPDQ